MLEVVGLARQYGQLGRVVQVASYDVAMANKLAAWNERLLVRDLYDLYFLYTNIKVMPDMDVLERRLQKVASTPKNRNPKRMTLDQLISKLRDCLTALSEKELLELADYLPNDELPGLDLKIRAQLLRMCDALSELT